MSHPFSLRRTRLSIAAALAVFAVAIPDAGAATGEQNFTNYCFACHTIGGGKRVGPDLKGVTERRSHEWLVKFVASSQSVVKSGDPDAVALFEEYKIEMPDAPYTADEIKEILAYIATGPTTQAFVPLRATTPQDIERGRALFQGHTRLAQGGPACNSCHHVKNDAVIGGGILAKDLTEVFARMGAPGINAILGKPPFPVMEEAYRNRPLSEDEVFALVAFLEDANRQQAFQQPNDYGFKLFYSGSAGFVLLLGIYGIIGRKRKKLSVNHKIFDRQTKSQ
ncbi:cytochrome c [bacterium]|nr:cytochrome c [bacterium]